MTPVLLSIDTKDFRMRRYVGKARTWDHYFNALPDHSEVEQLRAIAKIIVPAKHEPEAA